VLPHFIKTAYRVANIYRKDLSMDQKPQSKKPETPPPQKREYKKPSLEDLGVMRIVTRKSGGDGDGVSGMYMMP
jgi:hypothetical protein